MLDNKQPRQMSRESEMSSRQNRSGFGNKLRSKQLCWSNRGATRSMLYVISAIASARWLLSHGGRLRKTFKR